MFLDAPNLSDSGVEISSHEISGENEVGSLEKTGELFINAI